MERLYNFKDSKEVGELGEQTVKNYLLSKPNIEEIVDVTKNRNYWEKDIDFIVRFIDGKEIVIEIKTDTYTTNNMFFETISSIEAQTPGCMYKTKAKYLFYYFINAGELYVIEVEPYREWFEKNRHNFRGCKVNNVGYTTYGYIIPLVLFKSKFHKYREYKYDPETKGFNKIL